MAGQQLSPAADLYGARAARVLLSGRKGHGGGPCVARRLTERELAVLCAAAFEAGRLYEQRQQTEGNTK